MTRSPWGDPLARENDGPDTVVRGPWPPAVPLDGSLGAAVDALRAGRLVVVVDDADREDEGDLIACAATITDAQVAFMVRHTTGIVCAPMPASTADRLGLEPMVRDNADPHGTAFTVTVDHVATGTGVSAADRAATLRSLADPTTRPEHLRRPGHVFPLRARAGGVLERPGHTEAAVDLLRLAGAVPVGVIGEIVGEDGAMLRPSGLREFATAHDLPIVDIAQLVAHRRRTEQLAQRVATCSLPTRHGVFSAHAYRSTLDDGEHLALVLGDVAAVNQQPAPLVRIHSECLTGDVLGSLRCDCGDQLDQSLAEIAAHGRGVLIYTRGHEGRGIGLVAKIRAYSLQERGLDTLDANLALGLPVDARTYEVAANVLTDLGVGRVRLLTNNPGKLEALRTHGIVVEERLGVQVTPNDHNVSYLRTKHERLGHDLDAQVAR